MNLGNVISVLMALRPSFYRIEASQHLNTANTSMCPCSKNLDSQEDYCPKIGTFWNIGNIGSRHAVIPKLGLSGPRTNINTFRPILNRSEHF